MTLTEARHVHLLACQAVTRARKLGNTRRLNAAYGAVREALHDVMRLEVGG